MRLSHIILCIAAIMGSTLYADTIVLKSGKKLEGHVISQNDDSYLVEIYVSKTIKDERRIPKDHVADIIKETQDSKEFRSVASLVPTPDLLTANAYQRRLRISREFISKYPDSIHNQEAKKIHATLANEFETISSGGIKQDGQLIARSDMEANAYEIHARMLLHKIKKNADARRYMQALRSWETLRSDYKNSTSFRQALPIAKRTLRFYESSLKQLLDTLETRIEKRKLALQTMNESDRQRTLDALAEKKNLYLKSLEKEKNQDNLKWLSVDPLDKESINQSLRLASTELNAVSKIDLSEIKPAGASYRDAWTSLAKEDIESAADHIKTLQSCKLPERYIQPLQDQLVEKQHAKKAAEEKAKQEAAARERARLEKLAKEAAEKAAAEKKKGKKKPKKK